MFPQLKKWLDSTKKFIKENGYVYSPFGRKRRLKNVFSPDRAIAGHEIRSGVNAIIQSAASDINLLGLIDTMNEVFAKKLDVEIFMVVHDSVVARVKEDQVDTYVEILKRNIQKDRGCSIKGSPIGVDIDIGDDYSFGDFDKVYGEQYKEYLMAA